MKNKSLAILFVIVFKIIAVWAIIFFLYIVGTISKGFCDTTTLTGTMSQSDDNFRNDSPLFNNLLSGIKIGFSRSGTLDRFQTQTDQNGKFSVELPRGKYTISIRQDGYDKNSTITVSGCHQIINLIVE